MGEEGQCEGGNLNFRVLADNARAARIPGLCYFATGAYSSVVCFQVSSLGTVYGISLLSVENRLCKVSLTL